MVPVFPYTGSPHGRVRCMESELFVISHPAFTRASAFPFPNFLPLDNAAVIVNPKGEMKGSAITGPVAKERADLWFQVASATGSII